MAGKNPYIDEPEYQLPKTAYTVTFLEGERRTEIVVEPDKIPYGETGLPGSLLDIAMAHNIAVDHACGGVCACSTCHLYVKEGGDSCSTAEDAENDMLDLAPEVRPTSRLACQCVPNGTKNLVVEVPGWNRNLVREGQ